jgi:hypothetical protein
MFDAVRGMLGLRGVVKTNRIWLTLAVLVVYRDPAGGSSGAAFILLAAAVFWAQACILGNDLADAADDAAAGKRRWISKLPGWGGSAFVGLLSAGGAAALLFGDAPRAAAGAYAAALALGLAYSLRPPRFKERGLLGPGAYALACAFGYAVMPWAWLGTDGRALAVLAPAAFLDAWVNLHFHQVVDYPTDQERGVRTWVVDVGLPRARTQLKLAAQASAAWSAAALLLILMTLPRGRALAASACTCALAVVSLHVWLSRRGPARTSRLIEELPWTYLALTFTLFRALPLAVLAALALQRPGARGLFLAALAMIGLESSQMYRYRYR